MDKQLYIPPTIDTHNIHSKPTSQQNHSIYDVVLDVFPKYKNVPLNELSEKFPFEKQMLQDKKDIGSKASEEDFKNLESRLVTYLKSFNSGHSYKNVAINEVGDRFLSILRYIDAIGNGATNPEAVKELKNAVYNSLVEKIGDFSASQFIVRDKKSRVNSEQNLMKKPDSYKDSDSRTFYAP